MVRSSWLMAAGLFSLAAPALVAPAQAGAGDLLVAPTRVVFENTRGTEIIVNNIGSETATYRISLVLRRMKADGSLEEIEESEANEREAKILSMVTYAPRRVTLAPNQPQAVRIGVRPPEDLADGEYRAHMLIRAIPDAKEPVISDKPAQGLTVSIIPIYGITIPVIMRKGALSAQVSIADPRVEETEGQPAFKLRMNRTGTKSTYGRLRVTRPGVSGPLFEARGLGIYAEVAERDVTLPIPPEVAARLRGPVHVEYLEDDPSIGGTIAEYKGVIR